MKRIKKIIIKNYTKLSYKTVAKVIDDELANTGRRWYGYADRAFTNNNNTYDFRMKRYGGLAIAKVKLVNDYFKRNLKKY